MTTTPARTGKDLIDASRPFAREDRARSWFHVVTTLAALCASMLMAGAAPWWPLRIAAAATTGLLLLRAFVIYHDYMHGAVVRDSWIGSALFHALGVLLLNPPRVWAHTHSFHHANTARLTAEPTGTYALWTVERWRAASWLSRLLYRLERHPITMLVGYATVFFFGMCVIPFVQNPRRYASSGLAAVVHVALSALLCSAFGPGVYVTTIVAPFFMACAIGSYLFYAQHNAPGIELSAPDDWNHADGATAGSTYTATGTLMQWFTGNIGFHHVHHLNTRIPFYRLPEAMKALPELQDPVMTTLRPSDVRACLRLALWDPARRRMVSFADA